jgi:SAM-dependent methyltransferase
MDTYADGRSVSARRRGKAALLAGLLARLRPEGEFRLADLGCADGAIPVALLASPLGARITEAVGLTLLDYNALPEKPAFEHPRFRRLVADLSRPLAETCPALAAASFQVVTATALLHYLEEPAAAFANAAYLLKPGGHLVATVPAPWVLCLRAHHPARPNTRIRHVLPLSAWRRMAEGLGWELVQAFRAQLTGAVFAPVRLAEALLERLGVLRLVGTNLVLVLRRPAAAEEGPGVGASPSRKK